MNFTPTNSLNVLLSNDGKQLPVGKLALRERQVWFQYDSSFLSSGIQLSPFHLPLKPGVVRGDPKIFDGLFGVFNDSLPDGWGMLLLDRHMTTLGIHHDSLTVLDRLACVGHKGMGALAYEPDYGTEEHSSEALNLDRLAQESREVLDGNSKAVFEELLSLNGSSQGARPKVMVGVQKDMKGVIHGTDELPKDYEHWLVKFTSSNDPEDSGAIEYAYSLIAKKAGINMPETYLFPAKKGAGYFGVKRFDRDGNKRLHVHTVSGLLHADHRLPSLDYKNILKAGMALTKSMPEVEALFRLAVFNVLAHNRDDHGKNFSFLMQPDGTWQAAPAYDLIFSSGPAGEHSTTVMGEGKAPAVDHLRRLAKEFDIKKTEDIIEQVSSSLADWEKFAIEAGVSPASRNRIAKTINRK